MTNNDVVHNSSPAEPGITSETAPFEALDVGLLLVAAGIWGSSFLFIAIGLDAFHPGLVTLLRVSFGLAALWLMPAARRPVPREAWSRISLLGVVWLGFPLSMFPLAQQWIDSSITGMLNAAMPIMTVIVAATVFGTPTNRKKFVGVVVGLVGIACIGVPTASADGTNAAGVLLVLAAVVSYGFAANLAGPLQREFGAVAVVARALLAALVVVLPFGLYGAANSGFGWGPLIACFALGAGGTGVAYVAGALLSGRVGAVRMSIITYLIPLVSATLGVVFRDETIGLWAIIGTLIVLVGAFLTSRG